MIDYYGHQVPASCDVRRMRLALENPHPRDNAITMDAGEHIYYINGACDYTSGTSRLDPFFNSFDTVKVSTMMVMKRGEFAKNYPKYAHLAVYDENKQFQPLPTAKALRKAWKTLGVEKSTLGSEIHKAIEITLNCVEMQYFRQYEADMLSRGWKIYRTEMMIYDEETKSCGCFDALFERNGEYLLADWKRVQIKPDEPFAKPALWPFVDLLATKLGKYTAQLNLYAYILAKNYGIKVCQMDVVSFHPENSGPEVFTVENIQPQIDLMMRTLIVPPPS
jgi:hypothetical protein